MKPVILVVDDNQTNRALLRDVLEPLGFAITEAENGRRAVELAEDCQPVVILMDISMPVMDGLSACREIRAMEGFTGVPIIVITAFGREDYEDEAYEAGCTHFLVKPLNFDYLLKLIAPYRPE